MAFQTINEYARLFRNSLKQNTVDFGKREFILRSDVKTLKDLKIAAVMDEFTFYCFEPECQLLNLDFNDPYAELDSFEPDLLFIESAWRGKDLKWRGNVERGAEAITKVANYCRARNIPIMFWNKEDPAHTTLWRDTARLADFVFTTDIDMLPVYKRAMGHDNVYHLHFGAQPLLHNPIEKYDRKPGACFAGTYYQKYQRRSAVFSKIVDLFKDHQGIEIYDRNLNDPKNYQFPERFRKYIVGTLAPQEIDKAYKGYNYGVNMNSMANSQTMFARRTFELMASNTVVVGNYSCGIHNYFGDLVISTDDMDLAEKIITELEADKRKEDGLRLQALNTVLRSHLYEDRLSDIVKIIFNKDLKKPLPKIHVLTLPGQNEESIQQLFKKQKYKNKKLITTDKLQNIPDDDFVCTFNENKFYGEEYLENLALSLRYSDFDGYSKPHNREEAYHQTNMLHLDSGIIKAKYLKPIDADEINNEHEFEGNFLFTDAYNYSADGTENYPYKVRNVGILDKILKNDYKNYDDEYDMLDIQNIFDRLDKKPPKSCVSSLVKNVLNICYSGKSSPNYVPLTEKIPLAPYNTTDTFKISFDAYGTSDLCEFYVCMHSEKAGDFLGPYFTSLNSTLMIDIPKECESFSVGVRFMRGGSINIKSIGICRKVITPIKFVDLNKTVILTNAYPSYEDPDVNLYVHTRAKSYKESGCNCSVLICDETSDYYIDEYEGVHVTRCNSMQLENALKDVRTVCVHYLTTPMWNILKKHLYHVKIIIWMHGIEIAPSSRVSFTSEYENPVFGTDEEKQALWNDIFEVNEFGNIHFVALSEYQLNQLKEDYPALADVSKEKIHIIHSFINTNVFQTEGKNTEDRLKILSIRSFSSPKYANDLAVKCIEALSSKEFFPELQFTIIGEGTLFDEMTEPLKAYENVKLEKRHLAHHEMISEYQKYGLFLVPTRYETQGISRDEAMACGLVPVTNKVAAVTEFCDEKCALLAEPENYQDMADLIELIYYNPDDFLEMSLNARERVCRESGFEQTIQREIKIIFN